MPDYIFRQVIKRKALDRWENEGGSFFADRAGIIKDDSPEKRADKNNAAQTSESPSADTIKNKFRAFN